MSRQTFDLVVVGAGVVGSAAALAAARDGLQVALVEAHPPKPWQAAEPDLRVFAFAPDNAALLDDLGVWKSVREARAWPYRRMRVWDAAAGGELCFDADALGHPALGHIVENGLLVDRLWAACGREAGISLHCPDKVVAISQDAQHATVTLAGGSQLRAKLVLGADGAASKVRQLAGLDAEAHDYGQRGLVAYVETELPHQDTAWQRFLPTGPLAFLPFADGRCSIVWSLPEAEAQRLLAADEATFLRELTRAFDARLGDVRSVSARAAFPLRRQLAKDCVAGRIALAGDAAHVVHPLAGQGVNLGLRDVSALRAQWRAAAAQGADFASPHRLARWARARRSENTLAAYSFEAINRAFSNDALLPTLLRGHVLGLAGRLPPVARLLWRRAAGV
ncbi:FAD-dependent oxidoreductase [Arenimonas caeni]|jgi:2-octaprenyl-3-methyl-6-methoxy-1,4-benzoquinol hydroxylase|uniref:2-octaprenyl-3-methyl-6-methoxy-1,4-benzoquinol hydroxylase n=2 Tax=Arenimonas caeni TaxID=2058085 RepID=A0A2P6MCV8_9GAMM|nr:FAD-dependent oxidoreductase [Arenimonas caeni]PRH83801.1 2-octaprenyl-3-methyl-6-methoxy-1,4-benzoquinol hydroxylase [Arenimonas caeni]